MISKNIHPVILAGGSGTRLWPLSRKNYPKQFLRLHGEQSLLQQTVQRVLSLNAASPLIVSNEAHYFLCQEQLQDYQLDEFYLLEPCPRNTGPAIASAANYLREKIAPHALMLVLPSDHWIGDDEAWREAMLTAAQFAIENQVLVTFGIRPDSAKTGYGYIEAGQACNEKIQQVLSFREKPDAELAAHFIAQGSYYWNSGMFMCRADVFLDEIGKYASEILQQSSLACSKGCQYHDYLRLDLDAFSQCEANSIDYLVMEKTQKAVVVPVTMAWSDLGCWRSVAESREQDAEGNSLQGNVMARNTHNCLISSEGTLVTTLGIKDQIIIATGDAVLVADKQYAQQVKDIVSQLGKEQHPLVHDHQRVFRPWGYYEILAEGEDFKVKRLMVKPGARLSLQMHQHRAEHWVVIGGEAEIVNDQQTSRLSVNQSTYIPQRTRHRLSNPGKEPLYVIEVQSGSYLGEDDIVRFDDIYQRQFLQSECVSS
ncbi:phosphomannose isomerase GDP mannose pyrophosphorylase [Legionella israelensis]|uniref:mannose-1-phosphate guanylyltransferase n=1 Tax=Legionella israelensis TaxID=454 RepID=A0A0W0WGR6_9GAMM|nr:mannose-1-phosphate guanylyltransferase/mannose-6-phosphate isomerase [Legionella israelensis]KTD31537.1 phosphomannose isomerase GDP mannose pyrophosphorylase [Legionella israelensis]QBS09458.1 mannose-1-phosphate guanylyltransferase/mannose-6-phosphate isomerase [Legionella israelensis]SCX95795.1 mannose-1-phosphate guanylyltransferase / mannose-6-phosphate isomerase [Legionella israelensis DSM 19235]STX60364.1 phosphomannose isomerase GDP mannose pyrophosphorylase [Legionella israelensis]